MVSDTNIGSSHLPALLAGECPPATSYDADIIILTCNRYQDTIEAVDSALRQVNGQFYVSILDQGSNPDVQKGFAEAFKNYKNFAYYRLTDNLGVGGGRNFLSSIGNGKIIIALDNDAIFADEFIAARAVHAFEETPKLGVLGFKILSEDGIHLDELSWGYPSRLKKHSAEIFVTTTFVGAGHAVRRTTWTSAGGYDADLFFTWEEYDLALRAIALGWLIKCDGTLAVIHKVSAEARVEWSRERTRLFIRNRLILARKWNLSWLNLTPRIGVYLVKAARNRRLNPAFAGLFAAVNQDRSLIKHSMNSHMLFYIKRNETRFHKGPLEYYCRFSVKPLSANRYSPGPDVH